MAVMVICIYQPKSGKENELQALLGEHHAVLHSWNWLLILFITRVPLTAHGWIYLSGFPKIILGLPTTFRRS